MTAMRLLLLSPTVLPEVTGNAITAERWRRLLEASGVTVTVAPSKGMSIPIFKETIARFRPDIIHGHQAVKTGAFLVEPSAVEVMADIPLIISVGGTDVNLGICEPNQRSVLEKVFMAAHIILTQSGALETLLREGFKGIQDRLHFAPRAPMWFGDMRLDIRALAGCNVDSILFYLPAGIRPVKGNVECLEMFEEVHTRNRRARVLFSGPSLDNDYAGVFSKKIEACNHFATWIPAVPPEAMKAAYEDADVILNTSASEGLSTVLLEAIFLGKPILASDIPGNRWLLKSVSGQLCGYIYDKANPADFIDKAVRLVDDISKREKISTLAREKACSLPRPEDEAEALLRAYQAVLKNFHNFS